MVYAALLRGINVGGKNKVSMLELKASIESLDFDSVKTYINSGNVVFSGNKKDARKVETQLEQKLETDFGFPLKVVVRTKAEIEETIDKVPRDWLVNNNLQRNVIFLRHEIDSPKILEGLNPKEGIDSVAYIPGVLFWAANTSNLTKSTMVKLLSNPIYKNMTIRTLSTVQKIHTMIKEIED
jgi:uncharacterized protein (DUF1697 family)